LLIRVCVIHFRFFTLSQRFSGLCGQSCLFLTLFRFCFGAENDFLSFSTLHLLRQFSPASPFFALSFLVAAVC
jgi:hypothetical protein